MNRSSVIILALVILVAVLLMIAKGKYEQKAPGSGAGGKSATTSESVKTKVVQAPPPDATITNSPTQAGTKVCKLPKLAEGSTRVIVDPDGCFDINSDGNLVRGINNIPAGGTKKITVRDTKSADGSSKDTTLTIAVKPAAWTIDAFPEMIINSFTQESVEHTGPVSSIKSGGVMAMERKDEKAAAPAGSEPVIKAKGKGIEFAADGAKYLAFKKDSDANALYRWTLVIFRADASSGSGNIASILRINDGPQPNGRSGNWIPRIDYDKSDHSVSAYYRGTKKHQLKTPAESVATDGRWNVVLTYRRHGRLFLRINGKDCGQPSPTESFSTERPEDIIESRIGDKASKSPAWALDGLWIGQSELSERVVEKMEAWALIRAAELPGGAAAAPAFKPVIDEEDFPQRYTFNADRWAKWKEANPKDKRLSHQGEPVSKVQPDRSGWVRVFCDDFRKPAAVSPRSINGSSVGDSTYDMGGGNQIWFAPGTNCAVGGKAICKDGNDLPFKEVYLLDPVAKNLTMRLYCAIPAKNGKPAQWRNSQFTSVNEAGFGYSWAGLKGFRVRAKLNNIGPGLFPCPIWFYNTESLFWRTGERIEFDIIELDDDWDNYGASHVHTGRFKGMFGHSAIDTMKKSAPKELKSLKLTAGKAVCGINAWDGNYHTWEVWIEDDLTYINVDGVEVVRVDTTPEYRERLYMYIDTCLKDMKGMNESLKYDLVLDKVEAFQPVSEVDVTPGAPFTGRPTLKGTAESGSVVTCNANVKDCKDVWYYWHSDGYPRGFGPSNTYTVLPEDKGCQIRCMVRAAGAKDQPIAWTAPLTAR
ncbi:MAG: hypothetical protein JXR97_02060 [Planctomycetes bacterium]|nr:hypothetical protein [Planctomycetota bacterium]